jgi:hypothetical protein
VIFKQSLYSLIVEIPEDTVGIVIGSDTGRGGRRYMNTTTHEEEGHFHE